MGRPASTAAVSQAGSRLASPAGAAWAGGRATRRVGRLEQGRAVQRCGRLVALLGQSAAQHSLPAGLPAARSLSEKYAASEAPVAMADSVGQAVAEAVDSLGNTVGGGEADGVWRSAGSAHRVNHT